MSSYYWAKVWIEILYDYKMARLTDRLWRRTVELVLLAKEYNKGGRLPRLEEMAFKLHSSPETLATELDDLAEVNIVRCLKDGWSLINFEKRQGAMDEAERTARYRARQKSQGYNEDVTEVSRGGNESVTNRYTEQNRIDKNRLYMTPEPPDLDHIEKRRVIVSAISGVVKDTCVIGINSDAFEQVADALLDDGADVDSIKRFGAWWKANGHYDGKPALKSLLQNYKASQPTKSDDIVGLTDAQISGRNQP